MGKKVLVLSASPRRGGNSDTLCDQFILGAREAGNEAEKIFLADKKINYCTGCFVCGGHGDCVQDDDMAGIIDKMMEADVIVMATPVYFYTMNAQMKTLIDRTCCRYTEISDKEFYFIMTAGDDRKQALERTLESLRAFTSCLKEPRERGAVYGTGVSGMGEIINTPAMGQAYEMGKRI